MNDDKKERNQRHYQRMREALATDQSHHDTDSLGSLIATLDGLFQALEGVDTNWGDRFRRHWGILEEVNAFALDSGRTGFSEEEQYLLNRAVQDIKSLTDEVPHRTTL
jgi:hypothetical protein